MGIRDAIGALFGGRDDGPSIEYLGPTFRKMILGLTPEELYRTQPHLRIVLSFVARNVAHLGLKAYARKSDSDRERLRDDPLAMLLKRPNPSMTMFELLVSLASDMGLYDTAYWYVHGDNNAPSGWVIQPIPPAWVVEQRGGTFFEAARYIVQPPSGKRFEIQAEDMIVFHGWNPGRPKSGTSPVETLKQVLAEQVQAWSYREQVWQRGGRVGAYLTRPKDAKWSDAARERFARDWKARWTGKDGQKAGGTPILEDGMELKRLGFSAREDEWAEVAKLALATVAGVYHVNPVMVGILDNANFSNTKEFRKMLYTETLGPTLAMIEDRLNTFLVPRVSKNDSAYVEFNIEEKLQGDFESQAAALQAAVGRPWMTPDEARALRNMPALGGDAGKVATPLNVLIGGQASPLDSAPKHVGDATFSRVTTPADRMLEEVAKSHPGLAMNIAHRKSPVPESHRAKAEEVIRAFFNRQAKSVLSRLGTKDPDWWEGERWDRELAADLLALALNTTREVAIAALDAVGFTDGDYDESRTEAFLAEVAKSRAGAINAVTREQVAAILAGTGPDGVTDPAHAFEVAKDGRLGTIVATLLTTFAAFAVVEAGRQTGAKSKTWIVTSTNPRPEHAAVNGETVGIDEKFSNGANWPGDPVLGAAGVSGCACEVRVNYS